jgi:hypothetical protein
MVAKHHGRSISLEKLRKISDHKVAAKPNHQSGKFSSRN